MADAVGELTGGVEIRDAETIIRAGAGRAVIVAQCAPEMEAEVLAEIEAAAARMKEAGVSVDPLSVRRREAHEDEWRDVWKQYFRATRVGRTFLIRPSWDLKPASEGDRVIDLDPGRAFGTGGHATTRLVIALGRGDRRPARGALPRSRVRLGDLVDRGRAALAVGARAGGRHRSGVGGDHRREPGAQPGHDRRDAGREPRRRVAARAIWCWRTSRRACWRRWPPIFRREWRPEGTVILSGILVDQADVVLRAFAAAGLRARGASRRGRVGRAASPPVA